MNPKIFVKNLLSKREKSFLKTFVPLALLATPLSAQTVSDCDWQASARNIPEPWADHTRTFANGAVRLSALDTVEPAAGAFYLMILSPPYAELGDRQCVLIGQQGMGFTDMTFAGLTADYDPAEGLVFTLPVGLYDVDTGATLPASLRVSLNQSTGAVRAALNR